jgi:hypothetical protein
MKGYQYLGLSVLIVVSGKCGGKRKEGSRRRTCVEGVPVNEVRLRGRQPALPSQAQNTGITACHNETM